MKTIQNCGKCGLCLTVCPVYRELKIESASPRARLQLIKSFENRSLLSSPRLKEIISQCLMCGSCAAMCPSGVDHYSRFMEMRQQMVKDHGETPAIKSLIWLLSKEYRLRMAGKVAKTGQKLVPSAFKEKYRLGNIALGSFPSFNETPFREKYPEINEPYGACRGNLVYFTGCATNYLFDDTGSSALNILRKMGFRVIIPSKQRCCSIPMLFHGAAEEAKRNIDANIRAIALQNMKEEALKAVLPGLSGTKRSMEDSIRQIDAVIVDCATCGTALRREYPAVLAKESKDDVDRGDLSRTATLIAEKTTDLLSFIEKRSDLLSILSSFLSDTSESEKKSGKNQVQLLIGKLSEKTGSFKAQKDDRVTVTYHAPCHLKNSPGGFSHVERLLKKVPLIDYVAASDVDQCCGGGGTFFYEYPELSGNMVARKLDNAKKAGADLWLTDCPVCRINLAGNIGIDPESGKPLIRLMHPVTLINEISEIF